MHVGPADFRSIRRDGLLFRFAMLGDIAYVLAEVPAAGSGGTALEDACERPHWAFVVSGEVELDAGPRPVVVRPGSAFHLPEGLPHRIHATGSTRLAGFERIDVRQDITDAGLRAQGFEVLAHGPGVSPGFARLLRSPSVVEQGEIATTGSPMGSLLFCQTRFGARSGYTSPFCDLEHWGQVVAGNIAIEWESDVEVLTAGDVFYCPPGPPGHRFQAADPSATIDFTPLDGFMSGGRVVEWRHELAMRARAEQHRRREIKVASLG
jgi:quercetin dioxygenase-like cupin family protein